MLYPSVFNLEAKLVLEMVSRTTHKLTVVAGLTLRDADATIYAKLEQILAFRIKHQSI